VAARAGF